MGKLLAAKCLMCEPEKGKGAEYKWANKQRFGESYICEQKFEANILVKCVVRCTGTTFTTVSIEHDCGDAPL